MYQRIEFYFVAHADDWQLFMNPEVSNDLADKTCKVVIVHTTAGDAGRETYFWKAREEAALDSVRFRLSVDEHLTHQILMQPINGKNIYCQRLNNCICYFLRLPDGGSDGSGFAAFNHQSLEKLHQQSILCINPVDQSCVYESLNELTGVIDGIIEKEIADMENMHNPPVMLNFPDPDKELNPYDHNDHYNTSYLLQATNAYSRFLKRAFKDYQLINIPVFLSQENLFWKIGMFSAYHQSMLKLTGHSTIAEDSSFIPWCFRNSSFRMI